MASSRLAMIFDTSEEYGIDILSFVDNHPEFNRFLPIVSLTTGPTDLSFKSSKEALKYYVCFAGVNTRYGEVLWNKVQQGDYSTLKSKLNTITAIDQLDENASIDSIDIKGVGPGCKTFAKQHVLNDYKNATYESDRIFRKGIQIIYNLDHFPTIREVKSITSTWEKDLKYIGTMFSFQAVHYGQNILDENQCYTEL